MKIYLIYLVIILVTVLLYFLVKDKKEFINKLGVATIISSTIVLVLGFILKLSLNTFLTNFNISKITSQVFREFIYNSIILLITGIIELFISKIINKNKLKVSSNKSSDINKKIL